MGFIFLVLDLTGNETTVRYFSVRCLSPHRHLWSGAGVYVDRRDRKRVMLAADAVRAVVLISLPVAAALGVLNIWYAGFAVVITTTCTTFFNPAYNSSLPIIVGDPAKLFGVNAIMQSSRQFAAIAGPAFAALGVAQSLTHRAALDQCGHLRNLICLYRPYRHEPRLARTRVDLAVPSLARSCQRAANHHRTERHSCGRSADAGQQCPADGAGNRRHSIAGARFLPWLACRFCVH